MLMLERKAMKIVRLIKFSPGEEVHKGNNMCIDMDRCCEPNESKHLVYIGIVCMLYFRFPQKQDLL